jgi:hypothetical protein
MIEGKGGYSPVKGRLFCGAVFVVVGVLVLCGLLFAQEEEFTILSILPPPDTLVPPVLTEIRIVFSREVVTHEDVGVSQDFSFLPLSINPPLQGQFLWEDEKTLVLKPKGALREATRYVFRFRDDFRDVRGKLLAGRHDFTLSTEPLRVLGIKQVDYTEEGGVVLECSFSLPVLPQKLRGFLTLRDSRGNEVPYALPLGPASTRLYLTTVPLQEPVLSVEILPGLTSERGPLGLEDAYRKTLEVTYAFEILENWVYFESPESCVITFNTSTPVDPEALAPFIRVDPPSPFTVRRSYGGFAIVGPFLPRERKVITVKRGAQARNGAKLLEDFTQAIIIPDLYPSVAFPVTGTYVTEALGARIPVTLLNVPKVRVLLWRLYDNNIPVALANLPQVPAEALGELVREETLFNDSPPNVPVRKALDLVHLTGNRKGTYLLIAQDASDESWAFAEHLVAFTDIGIVAKVFPQGILVWANSLRDGTPLVNAWVKVFSRTNQLLLEGTCDEGGLFLGTRDIPWDEKTRPYIVTVQTTDDLSFLVLEGELFAVSGFDITGREYLRKGYEAFLYLPRGVFRPGEELKAQAIVRGPELLPPPAFPIRFAVRNPLGREIAEESTMLSPQGGATFSLLLPENAPTGAYVLSLTLPDGKTVLAEKQFLVEEFAPPRLRVNLQASSLSVATGEDVSVDVTGEYLFGRKASGLPFTAQVVFESTPPSFPDFATYTFGNKEATFSPFTLPLGEGTLNEEGRASFSFTVPPDLRPPAFLTGKVTVTVSDPAGRPVSESLNILVSPYPVYLGVALPEGEFEPGVPLAIALVALDREGKPKETEVNLRILRILRHFVLSAPEEGEGLRYREEEEWVPEVETSLALAEGKGTYTFTPKTYGEYLLEVSEPQSLSTTTRRFFVFGRYGLAPQGEALPDRLNLVLDKSRYRLGEEATLRYRAPFAGKALFTVETDTIVLSRIVALEESGEIRFEVTEAMAPNAYCSLVLLKEGTPQEGPLRALGVTPLFVDQEDHRLVVTITTQTSARPGEKLPCTVTVRDTHGNPVPGAEVALSLVDVGVLALTDEPVPDPLGFFSAKRRLGVGTFDLYGNLILGEPQTTPLLHPAGGAPEEAFLKAQLSFLRPALFEILSLFVSGLVTDKEGKVTLELALPDVATTARMVALAFKEDQFGSSATEVLLEEEIVAEVLHPKALAPEDTCTIPVTVFSKNDAPTQVTLTLSTNDLLEVTPKEVTLTLPPRGKDVAYFSAKTLGIVGDAEMNLSVRFAEKTKHRAFRFPIRPAAPRITISLAGSVNPGEEETLDIPESFVVRTFRGQLLLSGTPDVDLRRLASILWEYPYGCLEQTTSSGWVALLLPEYLQDLDPLLAPRALAEKHLMRKIRRILSLQTPDGGFSAWPGGESRPWDSAYAYHFLLEAQKQGVDIPPPPLEEAKSYLLRFLTMPPYTSWEEELRDFYTAKAYAAYVLALSGERPLSTLEELREKRTYLRESGVFFLALTYALLGQKDLARSLVGEWTPDLSREPQSGGVYESPLREGALALLLELELDPTHTRATYLAGKLQEVLRERAYLSTQEAAFLLFALSRYFAQEKRAETFEAKILGKTGETLASSSGRDRAGLDLTLLPSPPWTIRNEGQGRIFYLLVAEGVPATPPSPWDRGIAVRRTYLDASGNPLKDLVVPRGEDILVLIELEAPRPLDNVVVVDLLPGGLEFTHLETPGETGEAMLPVFVDRRDDRVVLFFSHLEGKVSYRYRVTAVTSGTFTVAPVQAECMYNPGVSSLSGGGTLRVE